MAIEKVDEVPFVVQKRRRGALAQYWTAMGYVIQLVRDIDPRLRYAIDTFTLIGLLWTVKTGASLLSSMFYGFRVFIWSRLWRSDLIKYGRYVVITGATDGIGLAYATEFAKRGHSLILISRNESRLEQTRRRLSRFTSADNIVTIAADLGTDMSVYQMIKERLVAYQNQIGILINNVGIMHKSPNRYMDQPEDDVLMHVKLNVISVLMMTRAVLPGMTARRKGLIINVSSFAAYEPLPLMGVYSSTKKFIEYFGRVIDHEYGASHNIEVQTLMPNYIATKMTKWSRFLQAATPSPDSFAASAVATIGRSKMTTGHWLHELEWFMFDWFVPKWMYRFSSWYLLKNLDSSRKNK